MAELESKGAPPVDMEDAIFIDYLGDLLTVEAPAPSPPGSRVKLNIRPSEQAAPLTLQGKVVSIAKKTSGKYEMKIRLHTLAKNHKSLLAQAAGLRRKGDEIRS